MARRIIEVRPILPGQVNEAQFRALIRKALRGAAKEVVKELEKGSQTWTHKPQWAIVPRFASGLGTWKVKVQTSSKPFIYVELGTLKGGRYRLMSKDWRSKTKPKVLRSGAGGGKATGFIPRGKRPMKGVTPRDFRVIVSKQYESKFVKKMLRTIQVGASNFWSGGGISTAGRTR